MKRVIAVIAVVLLAAGCGSGTKVSPFQTVKVKRGDIVAAISATGTIEPEEVADVGAQVVGLILTFGTDVDGKPVDYRSVVKKDMVLAKIDPSVYAATVASAKAQLEQAQANGESAKANLLQMQAKLEEAAADWKRAQKIGTASGALAQTAYDQYKATYDVGVANVEAAKASILVAAANADQDQAALDMANRNLTFCTITSPVDGTIISRRVNIGQTVVSSMSAPSLFLIAKDLTRMQIWVAVNEADIGNIHPGQAVTFTADAFPGKVFDGKVNRVRLNATMTQNVVTYTVEVNVENKSGILLPYLTANAKFETGHKEDVLMVANAALRWRPMPSERAPASKEASGTASAKSEDTAGKGPIAQKADKTGETDDAEAPATPQARGTVWVADGPYARPVRVHVGLNDGTNTEISGEGLSEGMEVITGEAQPGSAQAAGGTTNPFVPQMPARKR